MDRQGEGLKECPFCGSEAVKVPSVEEIYMTINESCLGRKEEFNAPHLRDLSMSVAQAIQDLIKDKLYEPITQVCPICGKSRPTNSEERGEMSDISSNIFCGIIDIVLIICISVLCFYVGYKCGSEDVLKGKVRYGTVTVNEYKRVE